MKIARYQLGQKDVDFLDHITAMWPNLSEDEALFRAIQAAFTVGGRVHDYCDFPVAPILVSSLAACSWIALGYEKGHSIPWDKCDHDYVVLKALRGLIFTSGMAWKQKKLDEIEGKLFLGSLQLPDWFPEWADRWEAL